MTTKTDYTQQNSQCRLFRNGVETVNHIREYSKLAQKEYKIRHEWIGIVFHREFCTRSDFDNTEKWYLHKSESVLENEMHETIGTLR